MTNTPKMQHVKDLIEEKLSDLNLPFLRVSTSDRICSSVVVSGSMEKEEDWSFNIFNNSPCFRLFIAPAQQDRYYEPGMKVSVKALIASNKLPNQKFRKYTNTPEKVAEKIREWCKKQVV